MGGVTKMLRVSKVGAVSAALIFAITTSTTAAFADDILVTITVQDAAPPCADTTYPATFTTLYGGDPGTIAPGDTATTSFGVSTTFGQDADCVSVYPTNYSVTHSGWTDIASAPATGLTTQVACDFETVVDIGAGLTCGPSISGISVAVVTDVSLASATYTDTITITMVP